MLFMLLKYKRKFKEMPHIDYGDEQFDLEFEVHKDVTTFLLRLKSILSGDTHHDKYGNSIQLRTQAERKSFVQGLKKNNVFKNFVKYKFSDKDKKLLNLLINKNK
jgi:hypothetical protein